MGHDACCWVVDFGGEVATDEESLGLLDFRYVLSAISPDSVVEEVLYPVSGYKVFWERWVLLDSFTVAVEYAVSVSYEYLCYRCGSLASSSGPG